MKKNNYKLFFALLLITFICFSCQNKNTNKDCSQFKNGNFIWKSKNASFSIIRKDSIQIEKEIGTNYYSKLFVSWIDDCHYEVKILESTYPFPDSIKEMRKKIILKTEIMSGTSDFYIFKSQSNQSSKIMIDTMWVDK